MTTVMSIKCIYRKNLKMSEGKLAAQVAHAVKNLGLTPTDCDIIVLGVSDKKFDEKVAELSLQFKDYLMDETLTKKFIRHYIQTDKGLTEVPKGATTAVAWIESEQKQ